MIKKYSDFVSGQATPQVAVPVSNKTVESVTTTRVTPVTDRQVTPAHERVENKPPVVNQRANEQQTFDVNGKVAICTRGQKVSEVIKRLQSDEESKVMYILSEQSDSSVAVAKVNPGTKINLHEFTKSLLEHYSKNDKTGKLFGDVTVNGDINIAIISNIPNVSGNGKKMIDVVQQDLINLLK